ncbi:MAG: hypothetical protein JO331_16465 [Verrucomicrobia bacterium]|nr:hypothetical protein [Verrucomicrobiota bacterium]
MDERKMREHLVEADAHIADTKSRIVGLANQTTEDAKQQLVLLNEELKTMQQRREELASKLGEHLD